MQTPKARIAIDTREPWPHPWMSFLGSQMPLQRVGLETGDIAILGLENLAVIERKTVPDLLACLGRERTRFERELARSRHVGRFAVVVEGTLDDLVRLAVGRGSVHPNAILGTLAAWTGRYRCPFMFCGSPLAAADFTLRFLRSPVREAEAIVAKVRPAVHPMETP